MCYNFNFYPNDDPEKKKTTEAIKDKNEEKRREQITLLNAHWWNNFTPRRPLGLCETPNHENI